MLRRIERTLVPRGYEMDATGRIPAATLARYLEHLRWEAMVDPDYRLRAVWTRGVVRAQRIEIVAPLRFGQEIRVSACVGRVGRTSLEFVHRVELVRSGELVLRAAATGVNLDGDGRPQPLPAAAHEIVTDEPAPEASPIPKLAPASAFTRELVVAPSDQDIQQHVNQARYIDFVEDTRALGAREQAFGGIHAAPASGVLRRVSIEYERQARFGERLRLACWGVDGEPQTFAAEIRHAERDEVVARARVDVATPG
jgi:acyl-CoA thioesterase FadM